MNLLNFSKMTNEQIKQEREKIRHEAINNAKAYHADIDAAYYENKSLEYILAYCHPIERNDFEFRLQKLKKQEDNNND